MNVRLDRADGVSQEAVSITGLNVPSGITIPPATLDAAAEQVDLPLHAAADAPLGTSTLTVRVNDDHHVASTTLTLQVVPSTKGNPVDVDVFTLDGQSGPAPLDTGLTVHAVGGGQSVDCQLDFDGDGAFEMDLGDCRTTRAIRHTFAHDGAYAPTLRVTSGTYNVTRSGYVRVGSNLKSPWVSGYYVGYDADYLPPNAVDFKSMTHVILGAALPQNPVTATGTRPPLRSDFYQGAAGAAWAKSTVDLAHKNGVKALVMIGGSDSNIDWEHATSPANMPGFINALVKLVNDYSFDGVDLDWEEFPQDDEAKRNEYYARIRTIAESLRKQRPSLLLTMPVGWMNANYDQPDRALVDLAPLFDQVNIMSYDMAGDWGEWNSWHFSALQDEGVRTPSSMSSSVARYIAAGVAPERIGIGIGFYGSCWRGVTAPRQKLSDYPLPDGILRNGNSDGVNEMSYAKIRTAYAGMTDVWDNDAKAAYLSYPGQDGYGPQHCNFVSYENSRSIAEKGAYVRKVQLGGTIIWTINEGYRPGATDPHELLHAARDAFLK